MRVAADLEFASFKRFEFSFVLRLAKWFLRPIIVGQIPQQSDSDFIYVLHRRSFLDVVLLRLAAELIQVQDPLSPIPSLGEQKRFFFLLRPEGLSRKYSMLRYSARMDRIQQTLIENPELPLRIVPVSMFWSRMAAKERSLSRTLLSERWATTANLRRWLGFIFSRKDIVVHYGTPVDWQATTNIDQTRERNLRRIARVLRRSFNETRLVVLGPDLVTDNTVVKQVTNSFSSLRNTGDQEGFSADETQRVKRETKAMASHLSYPMMRFFNLVLTWFWHRIYEDIEMLEADRLAEVARTHTLIYAPNHRSQTDFLVLSYMLFYAGYALPRIAAGDNMNFPVVGPLLRRCGAFFMRRTFRDDEVYQDVLASYLHMIVERGNPVEFFVEGGRSRTGLMLEPKFGLLNMVLESQKRGLPKPVALVPVYIGYESIPERNTYFAELRGEPKRAESWRDLLGNLSLLRKNMGKVSVKIGRPIKLDRFGRPGEEPSHLVFRLGRDLTRKINQTAILNAPNLVGLALLATPSRVIDEPSLASYLDTLVKLTRLEAKHHDFTVPTASGHELIARTELLEHVERDTDGEVPLVSCNDENARALNWFRNNVLQVVAIPSLLCCLVVHRSTPLSEFQCFGMVRSLEPFIAEELTTVPSIGAVRRSLRHLVAIGLIQEEDGKYSAIPPASKEHFKLTLLANCVMPILERFYVTGVLMQNASPQELTQSELAEQAHQTYQLLNKLHGHEFPEFVPKTQFNRFTTALVENGLLVENDQGRLTLSGAADEVMAQSEEVISDQFRQTLTRIWNS